MECSEWSFAGCYSYSLWMNKRPKLDIEKHDDGIIMLESVSEKWKLWKEWKQANTSKERYLEVKKARRAVYQTKWKVKRKRFGNKCGGMNRNLIYSKRLVKTNLDVISEHCTRNNNGALAIKNRKISFKHGNLEKNYLKKFS